MQNKHFFYSTRWASGKLGKNAGIEYELTSESGDFKYYRYNNADYGHYCEVIIYAGDDGHFPINTVMEVACSNEFE